MLGKKIIYLILAAFVYLVFYSCANMGNPTGGPKDTIPPMVVKADPEFNALNVEGDEIRLTFDEYIISDEVFQKLIISPPVKQRPSVRMKSKTLILQFNDTLKANTTYSLDFKDAIVDNNEKNPLENFRMAFSTGNTIDSLRISGKVINAQTLEPVENMLVMAYRSNHDSVFVTGQPDFIAKTDKEGKFSITNLPGHSYKVCVLKDLNSDMKYNAGLEEMAFCDSLIIPDARYISAPDTVVKNGDTLVIAGKTQFFPGLVYFRTSAEYVFNQYLDSYNRDSRNHCSFIFSQPVSDDFDIQLIDQQDKQWSYMEKNATKDTINLWITDTLVGRADTLMLNVHYLVPDSLQDPVIKNDTLTLLYKEREVTTKKKNKRKKESKVKKQVFLH